MCKKDPNSQRHLQKLLLVDTKKMSKKEGIEKMKIIQAFAIKKKAGHPKAGKEMREINKIIGRKDTPKIRAAIKHENHWPTKAMLIRNLARIEYSLIAVNE